MVNISMILKFLTWQGFDEFGWNDPAFNLLSNTFCCLLVLGAKYPDSLFDSSRDLLDHRLLSTLESLLLNQATCGQINNLSYLQTFVLQIMFINWKVNYSFSISTAADCLLVKDLSDETLIFLICVLNYRSVKDQIF